MGKLVPGTKQVVLLLTSRDECLCCMAICSILQWL